MQSETESGRKLGPMMTSFNHRKETQVKWFGHVSRSAGLAKAKGKSYKEQCKEGEEEAVKKIVGRITSLSGQKEKKIR